MLTAFEKHLIVNYGYCDMHDRMSLSNLLKETQQISMEQCDREGIGFSALVPMHLAFLMVKQRAIIRQMPYGGSTVRLRTEPTVNGVIYRRLNRLFGESGEELAMVDSRWILMDTALGRILRRPPQSMAGMFQAGEGGEDIRIEERRDMQKIEELRVRQSMVDTNLHLNNASYADLICNALEEELAAGSAIQEFSIHYAAQLPFGRRFELYRAQEGDSFFVEGRSGATLFFQSMARLRRKQAVDE